MLNVSEPLVKRARSVHAHGTPELVKAVERDEVTVGSAAKRSPTATAERTAGRRIEHTAREETRHDDEQ
ncbi:MAG: hypothetical protein AB1716_04225 [Planctomycetota bacterium]